MPASNGIIGTDVAPGINIPQATADDSQLKELKSAAKFAKSTEYKELKDHLEKRMDFYRKYLPDGRAVGAEMSTQDLANMWIVANCIIGELNAILGVYDGAEDMLKEAEGNATS